MTTNVKLGHVGPPPTGDDPRRRVLAIRGGTAIVAVQSRSGNGWRCNVIAQQPCGGPGRITITDAELAAGSPTMDVDPVRDPDGYAMGWLAVVSTTAPGGHTSTLARALVEDSALRTPGSLAIRLTAHDTQRLARAVHAREIGIRTILHTLVTSGLLTVEDGDADWTTYRLRIPTDASTCQVCR
ncbi:MULTISPECIES: hypothetical protein [Asanoa]|uniref:Uncharacterized protein n=2 Tax=Asanoa TaxID=195964 RepID=A0A239PI27_9ACTN|nr:MULTISPECIES: hypothetical protein [Asanoa]GIF74232.1 hypothetical protein Asi02nite_37500 [Asanoa siamensis]SNT66268.1 hypothetical protein SAMN05421812_13615 [Asanoa hainanensis]